MARPQVANAGDGLRIWRVVANILINCCGQPTRGSAPPWGLGEGQKLLTAKNAASYEMLHRLSKLVSFVNAVMNLRVPQKAENLLFM